MWRSTNASIRRVRTLVSFGRQRTCARCSKAARCASRIVDCDRVQDAYSLRCMPQVHGAVRDTLAHCREVIEIEVNSAVDNPLVFLKNTTSHTGRAPTVRAEQAPPAWKPT